MAFGQTFAWKKKEGKVALYYKPDKGKGRLVTDNKGLYGLYNSGARR